MITIEVPEMEQWDPVNEVFLYPEATTLKLEHSLLSISKWESKWCKPFLSREEKTVEETIDYVRCMTLNHPSNPNIYNNLTKKNISDIDSYIKAPMSATWFSEKNGPKSREIITSEVIYYWMIAYNVPFDPCEKWHLNRLLNLIRVCEDKNTPKKKLSTKELYARNKSLNAARKAALNTHG